MKQSELPSKFRPLSAWSYFGLSVLYAIPILGLIFLLIHTFSDKNINRRSFARSFWCWVVLLIFFLLISMSPSCLSQGPYRSTLMRRGAVRACTAGSYIASTATPGAMKSPELTTRTA